MEAIILAGGMGTRLRGIISDLPKPMAPVNGKPFLFYILKWLKDYNADKIILATGYMSESISDYFGKSFYGVPLEYSVEKKPLGTGGAVRFALQKSYGENVLVVNGDTYFPIELGRFFMFHSGKQNQFSIGLKPMKEFSRYGSVECSGDTVIRFKEKKFCSGGLINGGIYLINRFIFESLQLPEIFSLEEDVLEKQAGSSLLKCMIFDEPFLDIGIPEDYLKAGILLKGDL